MHEFPPVLCVFLSIHTSLTFSIQESSVTSVASPWTNESFSEGFRVDMKASRRLEFTMAFGKRARMLEQ